MTAKDVESIGLCGQLQEVQDQCCANHVAFSKEIIEIVSRAKQSPDLEPQINETDHALYKRRQKIEITWEDVSGAQYSVIAT